VGPINGNFPVIESIGTTGNTGVTDRPNELKELRQCVGITGRVTNGTKHMELSPS
jgi:hypothetical protein